MGAPLDGILVVALEQAVEYGAGASEVAESFISAANQIRIDGDELTDELVG